MPPAARAPRPGSTTPGERSKDRAIDPQPRPLPRRRTPPSFRRRARRKLAGLALDFLKEKRSLSTQVSRDVGPALADAAADQASEISDVSEMSLDLSEALEDAVASLTGGAVGGAPAARLWWLSVWLLMSW
jgi:hypothetical protein